MPSCVEIDVIPRPTRARIAILVVIIVLVTIAGRDGVAVPDVVLSAVLSAVLGAHVVRGQA